MSYNEDLTDKVRRAMGGRRHVEEKRMFGGIAFMLNGKMCVTVGHDRLMCRIDPDLHDAATKKVGARTVKMGGREYRGFVYVGKQGLRTQRQLAAWIGLALEFNKRAQPSRRRTRKTGRQIVAATKTAIPSRVFPGRDGNKPTRGRRAMQRAKRSGPDAPNAGQQLNGFIGKFEPKYQKLIRAVRKTLRRRFPTACELVYDNYNFFVIGYSPTERAFDAIISMTAGASGLGLCFIHGAGLPDPRGLLLGSGSQTRFIRLESAEVLQRREVQALISAAVAAAKVPMPATGRGKLIIKSISAKQRPRRR
jgi:TfoX/Sxy family transcriptional regulator of competence genes